MSLLADVFHAAADEALGDPVIVRSLSSFYESVLSSSSVPLTMPKQKKARTKMQSNASGDTY